MTPKQIGQHIRERRRALGITQADVARLAECSKPSVVAAEAGKSTLRLDKLLAILNVLGFSLALAESDGEA